MGTGTEHMSLSDILHNFKKIIIPDVQRDYVMGSGGEKLIKLLTAMAENNDKKENFNFSCLVGYEDKDNLYIYDGQQRLATLVCLCSYLNKDTEIQNLLDKFSFTKRDTANTWLNDPRKIKEDDAVDFTTYSLSQLIKEFNTHQIRIGYDKYKLSDKRTFEFLFKRTFFDMVLVDEISDAEQFFLDINDGLDLKSYEIYKAELYHHAAEVLKESFKEFALKMENEWLKFFLQYRHQKSEWINGANETIEIHCEEEMLMFFLQYCFRMMWIEENGSDDEFKTANVRWLEEEHFERAEQITDAIINVTKNASVPPISCINYSDKKSKGQHWNINDKNYIAMLKVFLKNVYNTVETNKDVIIWCYISELPFIDQNENRLHKHLRFMKKLLNNNRKICNNATIEFHNWGVSSKKIFYTRYYVQGIPKYYECEKDACDENLSSFLNAVIVLNKEFVNNDVLDIYISTCENESLKNILKNENLKHDSEQQKCIEEYENLPFINGLVDNFLTYTDKTCYLKDFCNDYFYRSISDENSVSSEYQYKDILKFIFENKIDISKTIFSGIDISWENYCKTKHSSVASLVPHTWCDLFTSEKGISINEKQSSDPLNYFEALPDAWFLNGKFIQPTEAKKGNGFASYSDTHSVWDMSNFMNNFDWIHKGQGKCIINGEEKPLPMYLRCRDDNNFIRGNLSNTEKVFYSEKPHINEILRSFVKNSIKSREENANSYVKEIKNNMLFIEMNNNKFFIDLKEI